MKKRVLLSRIAKTRKKVLASLTNSTRPSDAANLKRVLRELDQFHARIKNERESKRLSNLIVATLGILAKLIYRLFNDDH